MFVLLAELSRATNQGFPQRCNVPARQNRLQYSEAVDLNLLHGLSCFRGPFHLLCLPSIASSRMPPHGPWHAGSCIREWMSALTDAHA